jgi:RNA polymerase sigma-32 factor
LSAPETPSDRKKRQQRPAPSAEAEVEEAALVPAEVQEVANRSELSPLPAAPSPRDLEGGDTLTRYMAQLAQHAPIPREEEHALAVRWREQGDVEAARQLVLSNLRLVVKIAMEYRRAWTNVLDLIQEGNLGLMQAVQRFDPYQGVKLSSYGAYWIRAYILKYIIDNIRMVRVGRSRAERKLFFRLNKEKRELERQGYRPEPKLLAEKLEVSEDEVRSMEQRLSESDLSLNAPVRRDDGSAEYGDFLPAPGASAEERVADAQLREVFLEKVYAFAEDCDERERRIIDERLLAEEPRTLQELGRDFGVSRERVRQLEARLLERMNAYLREHLVDYELYTTPQD